MSIAQAENYLRVENGLSPDTDQQDDIALMISSARAAAETLQGRDLVRKQWDVVMDYWPGWQIELRDPLVSVDSFSYTDSAGVETTMVEGTDFIVDAAKSTPILMPAENKFWPSFRPRRSSAILIRFTAGYLPTDQWWKGNPGAQVHRGMLLLVSNWFDNRLPFTRGIGNIEEFPFAVTRLLSAGTNVE